MKLKKCGILVLSGVALLSLVGCNKDAGKGYTYNTYLSTNPKTWNTHDWETNDESYIPAFTEIGLYDIAWDGKDGYEVVPEMAAWNQEDVDNGTVGPKDVTEEVFSNDDGTLYDKYGYRGNPDTGYVWEIDLNPNACWEDGTPINADTYVQSMERLLNPSLVNYRADGWYANGVVLANAERYYKQGRKTLDECYKYIDNSSGEYTDATFAQDGKYYINIAKPISWASTPFGDSAQGDETLYTITNNTPNNFTSDKVKLAAKRIEDAISYYVWKYEEDKGDHAAEWAEKVHGLDTIDQVDIEEWCNYDIWIGEFTDKEVFARTKYDQKMISEDETTYELYTEDSLKADLQTLVSTWQRNSKSWYWQYPLFAMVKNNYKQDFDGVGIEKINEYKIRLYLTQQIGQLDLIFSLTGNWIVKVDLYDKLTTTLQTGSKQTTYASNKVENYASYGPYKLTKFQSGKHILMERNEKWYGYTDGHHVNQFQMTAIDTSIIPEHNTALLEFEKGNLDDIELTKQDMTKYGLSSRKTVTPESYTQKVSFNTDYKTLLQRQTGTDNKTVLTNLDFRKGLSLAIDRNDFASRATAGSEAFTSLLNRMYLSNVRKGEMYRDTEAGKGVYDAVYKELGGNPYAEDYTVSALSEESCGYNINMATWYVQKGLEAELNSTKEGHLNNGDTIAIEFRVYDNTSENTKAAYARLVEYWWGTDNNPGVIKRAVEKIKQANSVPGFTGIDFELSMTKDEDYYTSASNGNYDMIFSIWGGAAIAPYNLMQVYCDSEFTQTCEYGFKGHQDEAFLEIDDDQDGTTTKKSFHDWYKEMTSITVPEDDTPETQAKRDRKNTILGGLEAGVLNRFEAIPIVSRSSTSLTSFKVENGTSKYISLIGYGGIRFMTFNYNDSEWQEFLKEVGKGYADLYTK